MSTPFVIVVVGLFALGVYFYPWLWRQRRMHNVRQQIANRRLLCLTYDDGPSLTLTPKILDLLHKHGAKATFFLVGEQASKYPEIVERIIRDGHEIGCHSDKHLNAWTSWPWRAVADIERGYQNLSKWLGANASFRPPHGKMTLPTYFAVKKRGAPVWWWTIDSGDTRNDLPQIQAIEEAVLKSQGGIVLMHDFHWRDCPEERDEFILSATAALIDLARQNSLSLSPLNGISS